MTKDVDAIYEPKSVINDLVAQIAEEKGLEKDWLNDSVKGFVNEKVKTDHFATYDNLKIATVTPEYLLAMKLMASRVTGRDYDDIKFLIKKLEIKEVDEAYKLLEGVFPVRLIPPKTMYVLAQILEEINNE